MNAKQWYQRRVAITAGGRRQNSFKVAYSCTGAVPIGIGKVRHLLVEVSQDVDIRMKFVAFAAVVLVIAICRAAEEISSRDLPEECRSCNPEQCKAPVGCLAGIVKDGCGCCDVCGKVEFELCDHPSVPREKTKPYYGRCGDNLECRLRTDLAPKNGPEAICYCRMEGALCGSDNETYDNLCQLKAAAVAKNTKITIVRKGPCNAAPEIISPPEHIKNTTGSNIAILCEAKGYPVPNIEWTWTRVDGKTIYLPSDDLHISVNMRGGPEKWQITGWLQIIDLTKEHEGNYTCIAQNENGMARASARVNVIADQGNKKF